MTRPLGHDWLTVEEAAKILGISRSTLYRWRDQGRLRFYHFGPRTVRLRADDLLALGQRPLPATTDASTTSASTSPDASSIPATAGFGLPQGGFVSALADELRNAVTWKQLLQTALEGLHATLAPSAVAFGGRHLPGSWRDPDSLPAATSHTEERPFRLLALPRNWLGAASSKAVPGGLQAEVVTGPYVAALVARVGAALGDRRHEGAPGEEIRATQAPHPSQASDVDWTIVALPVDLPQELKHEPPRLLIDVPLCWNRTAADPKPSSDGLLILADPKADLWLRHGQQVLALWSLLLEQAADNIARASHYETLALTDHLTGLRNRRAFEYMLEREIERTRRYGRPMSLMLVDLDGFKCINDCYGHPVGDQALQWVGKGLRSNVREADVVARVGGDEFAIICPETDSRGAETLGRRLLGSGPRLSVTGPTRLSLSIGIAEASGDSLTVSELYRRADLALYAAKDAGGGRLCVYSAELETDAAQIGQETR